MYYCNKLKKISFFISSFFLVFISTILVEINKRRNKNERERRRANKHQQKKKMKMKMKHFKLIKEEERKKNT
jgi:membrane-anchored glycerophosphoryl diester phosphodiesterase (GDPDase)